MVTIRTTETFTVYVNPNLVEATFIKGGVHYTRSGAGFFQGDAAHATNVTGFLDLLALEDVPV